MRPIEPGEARAVLSHYLTDEVLDEVLAYEPTSVSAEQWGQMRAFCLGLLPYLTPVSTEAFRKQMQPLLKFLGWARTCGYPLQVEVLFTKEMVETWRDVAYKDAASRKPTIKKKTVTDYVSRLRQMGPRLNPDGEWPPQASDVDGGVKRHLRGPYTDEEIALFEDAIATMPAGPSREQARAFMAMGLGFGPQPGE